MPGNPLLALAVQPSDIGGAFLEGQQDAYKQRSMKLSALMQQYQIDAAQQKAERENLLQQTYQEVAPDILGGDEAKQQAALGRLGQADLPTALATKGTLAAQRKVQLDTEGAQFEQAQKHLDFIGSQAQAILSADPAVRPLMYSQALRQARDMGIDTSKMPAEYSDAAVKQTAAQAMTVSQQLQQAFQGRQETRAEATQAETIRHNRATEATAARAAAATEERASAAAGGRTIKERNRNILINGDPGSAEYGAAYAQESAPRVVFDPQTGEQITITPDMSWARKPAVGGAGAVRAPIEGGAAPPGAATGRPMVEAAPGRAAGPARATFEANTNAAQKDIDAAEKLFFPKGIKEGDFASGTAASGAFGGVPGTQGRDAQQAIRRAVEVLLRLRTGAAAPDSEVNNYVGMFSPSVFDSKEGARTKMQRLRAFFEDSKQVAASKLGRAVPSGEATKLPQPKTPEEAMKLPPGTRIMLPDGTEGVVPGA